MAKKCIKNLLVIVISIINLADKSFCEEITEESITRAAEYIMQKESKDYEGIPFLETQESMDSLKEAIKLALREKVYTQHGAKSLEDIFDRTFGSPSTENYLFIRMLFRYMVDEDLGIDDAIKRLHDVINNRLNDVETYARTADIEKMFKKSSEEIAKKIRKINETRNVLPAKDIFELLKSIEPSVENSEETIKKILEKIPSKTQTSVQSKSGNILTFLLNEHKAGNKPIAINWRTSEQDAGLLHEYIPEIKESLTKTSKNEQHEPCVYSEKLNLYPSKNISAEKIKLNTPLKVDLISVNAVTDASTDQEIRELVRMQGVIALITGHDVLIISMSGFDVTQKRLVEIGKIYNKELNNPLIQGKFKKVIFIKGEKTLETK